MSRLTHCSVIGSAAMHHYTLSMYPSYIKHDRLLETNSYNAIQLYQKKLFRKNIINKNYSQVISQALRYHGIGVNSY